MKHPIIFFIFCSSLVQHIFPNDFQLQTGDLLFQVAQSSGLSDAIAGVTSGKDNIPYTHVGIVSIEDDTVFVVEATPSVVCKTPVDTFLVRSATVAGKPLVSVGRLKPEYRATVPQALVRAKNQLGRPYDFVYSPDNEAYYCSELVAVSFLNEKDESLFPSQTMTFRDETGNFPAYWINHFEEYQTEIPEGCPGTNPGDLSKSEVIAIVFCYFE